MTHADEPRAPRLIAALIFTLAAFTLLWPLLGDKVLLGGMHSDMFIAGYAFRLFGAESFKTTGAIPQWNPYLFGGLPYVAAMHGDIFYPTAWLRWIMPVDLAITWGMVAHLVLAGWFTYVLLRELRMRWGAAVIGGVAYELSGIVASQMSPGHDGKIFVSAIAPLAFWIVLRAVRRRELWLYGVLAFVVALAILGHYHMAYFLLLALGLWMLYLLFWSGERVATPWLHVGLAAAAVIVGVGISAIQVLPFLKYIPYSPRADGGADTGLGIRDELRDAAARSVHAHPPRVQRYSRSLLGAEHAQAPHGIPGTVADRPGDLRVRRSRPEASRHCPERWRRGVLAARLRRIFTALSNPVQHSAIPEQDQGDGHGLLS